MEKLDLKKQEELKGLIEYVLEPVNGNVLYFLDSYKMRHSVKHGNEPERTWEEVFYPVIVSLNSKEDSMSISNLYLNNIEDAIWRACHDFVYSNLISDIEKESILKTLYSSGFLEFRKGKK
jgi:hypothetical protein